MSAVELERNEHVATVWLSAPERRNAMGPAFFSELPQRVQEAAEDPNIRAVVIAARGEHFSAGLDLKSEIGQQLQASLGGGLAADRQRLYTFIHQLQESFRTVAQCPKPVVAAVHGACIGGGLDLISACDFRLAAADTIISLRETRMAIVADLGSLQRLSRIIGQGHLRELAFTGRDLDAHQAERMGLVNEVLPDAASTVARAQQLAQDIADNSPLTVMGVKRMLNAMDQRQVDDGLELVALWNAAFLPSEDLMEAVGAFVQKRKPTFRGR